QNGKIDGHELEQLREVVYADGKVSAPEMEMLLFMHKRITRVTPAFEQFVYQATKDFLLADGKIDAQEAAWLRKVMLSDSKLGERGKKLLRELRGEAKQVAPEFTALCEECLT